MRSFSTSFAACWARRTSKTASSFCTRFRKWRVSSKTKVDTLYRFTFHLGTAYQESAVGDSAGLAGAALVGNSLCPGLEEHTIRETEVQIGNAG